MKISKSFLLRLFWFGAGGGLSILASTQLNRLFSTYFGFGHYLAYGLTLAIVTALLFLWNYFVGFKTDRHWTHAAWRQGVSQVGCVALDYFLVTTLIGNFQGHDSVIIAAVKIFVAVFVKFGLYHFWIYPQRASDLEAEAGSTERAVDGLK